VFALVFRRLFFSCPSLIPYARPYVLLLPLLPVLLCRFGVHSLTSVSLVDVRAQCKADVSSSASSASVLRSDYSKALA
jgi:hypothetical protein